VLLWVSGTDEPDELLPDQIAQRPAHRLKLCARGLASAEDVLSKRSRPDTEVVWYPLPPRR
jgi:hypothetical protein